MAIECTLDGKTAIVTGGGRGLGRTIATVFAEAGADVVVAARSEEEIEAVADQVREHGVDALAVPTDLTELDQLDRLVDETEATFGRPDILVNNAGVNFRGTLFDRSESEADTMLSVNLRAAFFLAQRFAESVVQADGDDDASIINISSVYGHIGVPSRTVYTATKSGIHGLTRGLAAEFSRDGITVNSVSPGRILIERIEELADADGEGSMDVDRVPLGRLGRPREVGYACLFLASDFAEYITGEDLRVDGGVGFTAAPYPVHRPDS